jgi:hypothetical protein
VQEKNSGGVFRPRFPVEDGESINGYRAIKHLRFHCFALSLGIHAQGDGKYEGRVARVQFRYSATSKTTSSSIGIPKGRLATPMINRTDVFSMPKTSRKRSETASATLGWSKKSP